MSNHAQPTLSSAAASNHGAALPSLELLEARRARDVLKVLLRKEQAAMAEFLVALADFDKRRGWEALGHARLFSFLVAELGLSTSSTYWRKSAAELLQDFPELERHLRQGQLCLTTMAELAKVLTEKNKDTVLPRFLGISSREAKEIVAELRPREAPPLRDVVTSVAPVCLRLEPALAFRLAPVALLPASLDVSVVPGAGRPPLDAQAHTDPESLRAPEMKMTHPGRVGMKPDEVEPLTADLSRLHFNVRREVVRKLEAARRGLGHAIRGATNEQVLEAALDLLLEKQARARGQVKKPRSTLTVAAPRLDAPRAEVPQAEAEDVTLKSLRDAPTPPPKEAPPPLALLPTEPTPTRPAPTEPAPTAPPNTEPRPPRREGPRETVPAAVRRAVWARDGEHCTWPLDGGGCCGSTHRLELDHVIPWADWGPSTVENLRVICAAHNRLAARRQFGERLMRRYVEGMDARPG